MSKVLETLVKGDLEGHLKRVNGLPDSQYGFRPKRSCTSALSHAQAGWLSGAAKGKVVGLMAFDLSAAFDTVAADQLVPMLRALGVTGRELQWFVCYMTGGRQSVVWDCTVGGLVDVLYGVRQGLILGPILFIILTSSMAKFLGVREDENVVYTEHLADGEHEGGGGQEACGEGGPLCWVYGEDGAQHERQENPAPFLVMCRQRGLYHRGGGWEHHLPGPATS
jgi:hypothetical protein